MHEPFVLDPASGSRMFYFDKADERVLFGDIRRESHILCDGRALEVNPDQVMDFRSLPFEDGAFDALRQRVDAVVAHGVPVLALHQGSGAFGGAYAAAVGGRWGEHSWHPPLGEIAFRAVDDEHPVSAGLAPFTAYDEGYSGLDLDEGLRPLLVVEHDGVPYPVVWQGPAASRVIVDSPSGNRVVDGWVFRCD